MYRKAVHIPIAIVHLGIIVGFFILLSLLLSFTSKAFAATRYVSPPDATHPIDSGTGTSTNPFRSLKRAIDASINGDTIRLSNGVHPLEGGAQPYIDPSCGNCDGSPEFGGFNQIVPTNQGFRILDKYLNIRGTSKTGTIIQAAAEYGMIFEYSTFNPMLQTSTIQNLTITGANGLPPSPDVPGKEVKETRSAVVIRNTNVVISNVNIQNNTVRGISVREGGKLTISGSNIINNGWDDIALYQSNPLINGDEAYALIDNNIIGNTATSPMACANFVPGAGVGITHDSRAEVRKNTIQCHWKGIVITADWGSSFPITILNNKIQYNQAYGISVEFSNHATTQILNNVIARNSQIGLLYDTSEGSAQGEVTNNIFFENGNAFSEAYATIYPRAGIAQTSSGVGNPFYRYNAFIGNLINNICQISFSTGYGVCVGSLDSSFIGSYGNIAVSTGSSVFVNTNNSQYVLKCSSAVAGAGSPWVRNNASTTGRSDMGVNGGFYPIKVPPDCEHICTSYSHKQSYLLTGNEITLINLPGCSSISSDLIGIIISYRAIVDWTNQRISSITFDNANLVKGCDINSHEYVTEIWYMSDPSDLGDLKVTWNQPNTDDIVITPVFFRDVNTSAAVNFSCNSDGGLWQTNPEIGRNPVVSVPSANNKIVFAGSTTYTGNNSIVFDNGGTNELYNSRTTNVVSSIAVHSGTGALTNMEWTGTNNWHWSAAGLSFVVF